MNPLSRWFVKTAFACLLLGVIARITTAAAAAGWLFPTWWLRVGPTATHLITLGWLTQLIFGVAHWFFPTISRDNPRGDERLGWAAYVAINVGLALRVVGEPMLAGTHAPQWGVVLAVSAVLHVAAVTLFAVMIFPRIKAPRGRAQGPRPKKKHA